MRVRIPGNQGIREMHVGQSVLHFGKDGYAEADHLSDAEIQRCIDFHFVVEGTRQKARAEAPKPASLPFDGEEDAASDQQETGDGEEAQGEEAGEIPAKPPRKTRGPRKGKGAN